MHDLASLILEGAVNSMEAGADLIDIKIDKRSAFVDVQIQDNGILLESGKWFDLGVSSKGEERGKGLFLIKSIDKNASLEKKDGFTTLRFQAFDDESIDAFDQLLFPIFQLPLAISVCYTIDGQVAFEMKKNKGEEPVRASQIARFKNFVRMKIRSV